MDKLYNMYNGQNGQIPCGTHWVSSVVVVAVVVEVVIKVVVVVVVVVLVSTK